MTKVWTRGYKLLGMFVALALFGCESQEDVQPGSMQSSLEQEQKKVKTTVYYGPLTAYLGGTARTWVEVVNGKPIAIGIELSEDVLVNLPEEMGEFVLKLPGQAHSTGIKTIMVGWNPMGHDPEGVYTIPHFDFHFYTITHGQIKQITGGVDEGAYTLQEKGIFPAVYTFGPVPFAVPHMGVHWSDITSPEFSPAGFSKTFIYGSNKDRVTFLEPMITLAYLRSLGANQSVETPIPSLLRYEDPGYYPESYTVTYDAASGTYSIALTDLIWHNRNK
ncbi:hypothetical protein [Pontibacter akesuensis]|uniref:DUF5602 domain-containing protein n=1 Tax=Pontibacter akesuensis TaxID=388950 RepID=A0A1I7FJH4_9BACT|nr:hypothetical protein [Pontibacter akesuensis]GHA61897.1 hypothetical protein GCM10007389_13100 [Pontibacter akesuensis]SFU36327.1 hypothetical protein SAMN04487941_0248 [Pontibacter akesuensis]